MRGDINTWSKHKQSIIWQQERSEPPPQHRRRRESGEILQHHLVDDPENDRSVWRCFNISFSQHNNLQEDRTKNSCRRVKMYVWHTEIDVYVKVSLQTVQRSKYCRGNVIDYSQNMTWWGYMHVHWWWTCILRLVELKETLWNAVSLVSGPHWDHQTPSTKCTI